MSEESVLEEAKRRGLPSEYVRLERDANKNRAKYGLTDKRVQSQLTEVVSSRAAKVDTATLEPELTSPDMESWWLPAPVRDWVEACHVAFGVPRAMAIAAALCSACAVTQGKVRVEVRPGWQEPLSLFWLVFSPTGSRKSALLKAATAPVRGLQAGIARDLEPDIYRLSNQKARLELQIARMRRAVKAHMHSEGSREHLGQLRELEDELSKCQVPLVPRWLFDDINPTVVPRKLKHNQEAEGIARLAVLDAEGTFLANLLGRHSGTMNVDPLLKGYSGEPIDMVRTVHGQDATADTHLDAAHISMCLLVQPHMLDKIRAEPDLISNGLIGRCLMTHLEHSITPLPWNAPEIPEYVQLGYERWIATLAGLPEGFVYQMPAQCMPTLKALHERLEEDRCSGSGAVGWTVRTLGRICRIVALTELVQSELSQLSTVPVGTGGATGGACVGVISKLTYLINSLYYAGLPSAQALEPISDPLARLTLRTLRWLVSVRQFKIGGVFTVRDLQRGLKVDKDRALDVCDSMVSSGHLEQLEPVTRRNRTLTVSYRILSLSDSSAPRPQLSLVREPPALPEPDPEEDGR